MKVNGLLDKHISVKELRNIIHNEPKTLYSQALKNFLFSPKDKRTIFPLDLPTEDIINKLYNFQINGDRTYTARINKDTLKLFHKSSKYENFIPKHLWNWIDKSDYKKLLEDSIIKLIKESYLYNDSGEKVYNFKDCTYLIPNKIKDNLITLSKLLTNCKFTVHQGHAGCGKSTGVMNTCKNNPDKKKMICSLSNTICNMFKQKVNDIDMFSCSKANYFLNNDGGIDIPKELKPINYDIIVLDEFSQWGFEWLELFIELIKNNTKADFHIMGDIDQIPSFLSSGSLLFTLMDEYPNNVINYTTQYRFANIPYYRDLINDITNCKIPNNTMMNELNDSILENVDCFITGTNKHVEYLNHKVVEKRFGITTYSNLWELLCKTSGRIPLIAKNTCKLTSGSKINRNTRYEVETILPNKGIILNSIVDDSKALVNNYELICNFDLAYAITVNKAQGLEWNNVCCYITSKDRNLKNYNALYVALTRGKNNIIVATEDEGYSFPKITINDLNNILKIKYIFTNNLKEVI